MRVCQNWHILFFHIPTGSQTVSNNVKCGAFEKTYPHFSMVLKYFGDFIL